MDSIPTSTIASLYLKLFNTPIGKQATLKTRNHGYRTEADNKSVNSFDPALWAQSADYPTKEYAELQKKPLEGMRISLPSEADIHQWQILVDGPKGSPYEVSNHQVQRLPNNVQAVWEHH